MKLCWKIWSLNLIIGWNGKGGDGKDWFPIIYDFPEEKNLKEFFGGTFLASWYLTLSSCYWVRLKPVNKTLWHHQLFHKIWGLPRLLLNQCSLLEVTYRPPMHVWDDCTSWSGNINIGWSNILCSNHFYLIKYLGNFDQHLELIESDSYEILKRTA